MSDIEVREDKGSMALVLPGEAEGEVVEIRVDLNDPVSSAVALDQLRTFENTILSDAKRLLTEAVVDHWRVTGERELELPGRLKAEVKSSTRTTVDPDILESRLREVGAPDTLIDKLITETTERKVDIRKARSASKANPRYEAAFDAAASTYQETPSVTIRRR